jgi:choice-of-anchor B domain-containing protein
MQVFDLTRLRGVESPQEFTADTVYQQFGRAHNIAINEDSGFAYVVGSTQCSGGLHMVDISTPKSPTFAGCFSTDGYTHDVQCVAYTGPDDDYQGAEICFASNEDSLTIINVSNKNAPVMLGKTDYPSIGYSHQGWLDQDQGMFFMGDELDELNFGMNTRTLMFDVSDLDNPAYAGAHLHGTSSIDHNLYIKGSYIYQANYHAGLKILRINRGKSTTLTEVGFFDTHPDDDSLDFGGAWNVYPFFDNGTILVSDINAGLFVLRASLGDDAAEIAPINGRLSGVWISEGLNDQVITLNVGEDDSGPFIFFTWFMYLNGESFWLVGNTVFKYGVDEVLIPTQRLDGLEFVTLGSELANRADIGTLTLHVHGCNDIHIVYDFEDLGSGELEFQRLSYVQGRECPE